MILTLTGPWLGPSNPLSRLASSTCPSRHGPSHPRGPGRPDPHCLIHALAEDTLARRLGPVLCGPARRCEHNRHHQVQVALSNPSTKSIENVALREKWKVEVSDLPRVLVHGTLKYLGISALQIVQCSGRLRKTSEGLKPVGGCLPLAPFFKMPQLYSRLWAQCRPAAQFREFGVWRNSRSPNSKFPSLNSE